MLQVAARVAARIASDDCQIVAVGENGDERALDEAGLDFWEAAETAEGLFREEGIRPSSEEEIAFAAICGGEVVGAATFGHHQEEGETVFTLSVAVADAWKRKGLGRRLVQKVIDEARAYGSGRFRVWVVNPNMVALLESMGFETEGREWTQSSPYMYLDL